MHVGLSIRNMGPQSQSEVLLACAKEAEAQGFESVWITDHLAIPPDDAEGSNGRYLDTLTTLAWLAGATQTVRLGSGVLILPYRPALPTLKQVATLQELSGGRLLLGVGVGWMDAEFRALGVPRAERGARTDAVLDLFQQVAKAGDPPIVHANGQAVLFRPNPPLPPVYVGGQARFAVPRAARYGAGWLPMARDLDHFQRIRQEALALVEQHEATLPPISVMMRLTSPDAIEGLATLGVERVVAGIGYDDLAGFNAAVRKVADIRRASGLG